MKQELREIFKESDLGRDSEKFFKRASTLLAVMNLADAPATFVLLVTMAKRYVEFFEIFRQSFVYSPGIDSLSIHATVFINLNGEQKPGAGLGNNAVIAILEAIKNSIGEQFPAIMGITFVDYQCSSKTGKEVAIEVAIIEWSDGSEKWKTAGVDLCAGNALVQAVLDAVNYKILKDRRELLTLNIG